MNNSDWTPPPPPTDDGPFGAGTQDFYAQEIRKGATKALVFGILSLLCCPPIFAFLAFNAANDVIGNIDTYDVEHGKRGLAQAAKVLAVIGIALWVVSIVVRAVTR